MVKKGDTLIEVTLAVGIFSMVAVSIVTVLSNDTSDAQTALETTLAREEINTQAEALRFIQSAYIASRDNTDDSSKQYNNLWKEITGKAVNADGDLDSERYVNYSPASCADLYSGDTEQASKAFVVNPRILSSGIENFEDINDTITFNKSDQSDENKPLTQTITYPRLIYNSDTTNALINNNSGNLIEKAEGIYVIAVKDANTTTINGEENKSAFYDFYIRTCWYASNADQPLTVSTVIRLYDPEALPAIVPKEKPICNNSSMQNTMQCFDPSKATGDTLSLTDSRDGTTYGVAKIGNLWWMTQSLKLSSAKLKKTTLSKDDTNTTYDFEMPTPCGDACTFNDESTYYNKAYYACSINDGCHYNYAAASAGTITGEENTNKANNDICPKGWRLPTKDEAEQVTQYENDFKPNKGGIWQHGSLNLTERGDWWTSDAYNSQTRYYLNYNANDNGELTVGIWNRNRFLAIFVRCVKK